MNVNVVSPISCKAQVPKNVHERLFNDAYYRGSKACLEYRTQARNISQWGCFDTTTIEVFKEKTKEGVKESLGLINYYIAPFKKAVLPMKDTLLDSFLALTEKDIVKAEDSLKI